MAGASPYVVRLDPDTARELAASGATLLFLDVPAGTHIGIDHQVRMELASLIAAATAASHLYIRCHVWH